MKHAIRFRTGVRMLLQVSLLSVASLTSVASPAQTLPRIQSAGAINLGFARDQPPFSYVDADGRPAGYVVELCRYVADEIGSQLGIAKLRTNFVPADLAAGLNPVQNGEVQLLCGAITETLRARERVSFSIPIFVTGVGALVHRDAPQSLLRALNGEVPHTGPTWRATVNAGLANHTYAVHAGSATEALVRDRIARLGVIAKVVTVKTHEAGVQLVAQRQADAFFADRAVLITYVARHAAMKDLVLLDRRFTLEPVALAMPRGDEDFRLAVDRALSTLYRSGAYVLPYSRHFGEPSATARVLFEAYALP